MPLLVEDRRNFLIGFVMGVGLGFLFELFLSLLLAGLANLGPQHFLGLQIVIIWLTYRVYGIGQWIASAPAILYFRRTQRPALARGLLAEAALVTVVNFLLWFYSWAQQDSFPHLLR